jgi:tRNA(Ile)-lysidine synthase
MRKISQLSYFCPMQNLFLDFIKKHALINDNESVLLAVSGGIDSVVLAHLFKRSSIKFGIAHCNFQLRGDDSDGDAVFVEQLSLDLAVPFHLIKFDTKAHASSLGISTQMAARDLRYKWFDGLLGAFDYKKIASAHHKNDNVETLVHNLTRGTSISGLRGMLPINKDLIRPLLGVSRNEIEAYAKAHEINWREDVSNKSHDYKRNFIRHEVLPKFEELNPKYIDVMNTSMAKNREVELIFKNRVKKLQQVLLKTSEHGEASIDIKQFKKEHIGPYLLSEVLKKYGINYKQCDQLLSMLDGYVGKQFVCDGYMLLIDRDSLIISPKTKDSTYHQLINASTKVINSKHQFNFSKSEAGVTIDTNEDKAYLDIDKLKFPLLLRTWQEGDYFRPLGMKGKKKLSDFMIDTKIPLNLKKEQEVILSEGKIVWVVGKRIDDRYKITDRTKNIFIITRTDDNV